MSKVMKFDDLLQHAAEKEQSKGEEKEIRLLDEEKTITCVRLSDNKIMGVMDEFRSAEATTESAIEKIDHFIYECCPELQNTELHKALDVAEPWDVVKRIFSVPERSAIADQLFEWMQLDAMTERQKNE